MHLAYVDESGDRGVHGSRTYTLGCVLVRSSQWKKSFDALIEFRRFLKNKVGIPVRTEIKANYLLHNSGPFRALALSEKARRFAYNGLMQIQPKIGVSTFAIVIDKPKLYVGTNPMLYAWTYLLQRLETLTRKTKDEVMVIHDEGEALFIRTVARKARRFGSSGSLFGSGYRKLPFEGLLDDPVPRDSRQSYFLQLADVSAYAAFRRAFPPPPRNLQIVHAATWDELGAARYAAADMRVGGPGSGIVLWPR